MADISGIPRKPVEKEDWSVTRRDGGGLSQPMSVGSAPSSSYTQRVPTMDKPTMGDYGKFEVPTMDQARLRELTRKSMGTQMSRQRMGLRDALRKAGYSDSPTMRGMLTEKALSGYGKGISDIRVGAQREAMAGYMPEYQAKVAGAQAEFGADVATQRTEFLADMQEYMGTMKQTEGYDTPRPRSGVSYGRIL